MYEAGSVDFQRVSSTGLRDMPGKIAVTVNRPTKAARALQ